MISRYKVLSARLATEFGQVQQAANRATKALQADAVTETDQAFRLDSAALNLHAFYTGTERLFEAVARELDGGLPQGPAWHRELLEQMAMEVPGVRPSILRAETRSALEEYLRFRHLVRNVYSWEFEPEKLDALVGHLPSVLQDLKADLDHFREFLDAASRADETPS